MRAIYSKYLNITILFALLASFTYAQPKINYKYKNSSLYAGIEVGSKGVKMSVIEVGKSNKKDLLFNPIKDSSVNTDFISFTGETFQATLRGLTNLYNTAINTYKIDPSRVFTAISSGVKVIADKESKQQWLLNLADSFKSNISDASKKVYVIDAMEEARLSHLGIVPDDRRYTTFLIDIGSGNTKGGYFPTGNTKDFKLFELSWGTKSTFNAAEKRLGDDKTLANFQKNIGRVINGDANPEIIYAVNISNAFNMSDYVAFSGGIAWASATLMFPELMQNPVVPVTYDELLKFNEKLLKDYAAVSDKLVKKMEANPLDTDAVDASKEIKRVNQVFDQKSMLAGTALLLSIMRQFDGVYEKKQFYLVKNGQVGWISAYVNQAISQ